MSSNEKHHRAILQSIAHSAMLERDLLPDFSAEALAELEELQMPIGTNDIPNEAHLDIRDMR